MLYTHSLQATETSNLNSIQYGRILNSNTLLLKTPTKLENTTNSYFLLEESYFVEILEEINNEYYYVNYIDIKGYVKKSDITLVNEQIENPFLTNITFDIIKPTYLFSEPKNNINLQQQYIQPTTNIFYYGKIYGDELAKNSGNVWYYCKILLNDKFCNGYIHSSFVNNITPIIQNPTKATNFVSQQQEITTLLNLNLTSQTLIIIIISLPILLLIFILLKGFKNV